MNKTHISKCLYFYNMQIFLYNVYVRKSCFSNITPKLKKRVFIHIQTFIQAHGNKDLCQTEGYRLSINSAKQQNTASVQAKEVMYRRLIKLLA